MRDISEFLRRERKKIGQILIEMGVLTEDKLNAALEEQASYEDPPLIGQILIKRKAIKEDDLVQALAKQFDVPFIDLDDIEIKPELKSSVPETLYEQCDFVVLEVTDEDMTIAMVDPTNYEIIDRLETITGFKVKFVLASPRKIRKILGKPEPGGEEEKKTDEVVGEKVSLKEVMDTMGLDVVAEEDEEEDGKTKADLLKKLSDQKPIIQFVNKVIIQAMKERASDIHFESRANRFLIRYRIDGDLYDRFSLPKKAADAIISRIKVMSNLNIAERMIPQDGAFTIWLNNLPTDFRVSIIPCAEGECIVLRILSKSNLKLDLKALGFEDADFKKFNRAIKRPYGMIITSGPTGSGKTTTLYASLQALNNEHHNIMTTEDPVEYRLKGLNQIQVHVVKDKPERSLTFAVALKAILRHDPDIVLLGEIRDFETADIAVKAALTGHLVFSTVHANNAIDVIGRMADIGINRYLLASAFIEVIAQRLVKTVCRNCMKDYTPTEEEQKRMALTEEEKEGLTRIVIGTGCDECRGGGYKGRQAIYEIMDVDDEIREMIASNQLLYDIKKVALTKGMSTLRGSCLNKLKRQETTVEEFLRITGG